MLPNVASMSRAVTVLPDSLGRSARLGWVAFLVAHIELPTLRLVAAPAPVRVDLGD